MIDSKLLIVDKNDYTSSLLATNLYQGGFKDIKIVADSSVLPKVVVDFRPDISIFNYHYDEPDSLILCSKLKQMSPQSLIVVIVSLGPAFKKVDLWAKQNKSIDLIVEKPLSNEHFFMTLKDLLEVKSSSQALQKKAQLLVNLVPEAALSVNAPEFNNEAKMFQATVLFTDIRRSTQLIVTMPPREYFQLLNDLLSAQAKLIKQHEGFVIKYTGDGVMAIFKGMGSSYLAMHCALALAKTGLNIQLSYGVGVAEGLVLAGLIGDSKNESQRFQYDVIGATVHLAARLCSMANAGEVIATKKLVTVAKLMDSSARDIGSLSIKGFTDEVECIAFNPSKPKIQEHAYERTI